jgi:YbbR domain-containing protein
MMKTLILKNWAAKIATLVLASVLWFLIKKNIEETASQGNMTQAPMVDVPTDAPHQDH